MQFKPSKQTPTEIALGLLLFPWSAFALLSTNAELLEAIKRLEYRVAGIEARMDKTT